MFANESLRRWMWAEHPSIAADWEESAPNDGTVYVSKSGRVKHETAVSAVAALNRHGHMLWLRRNDNGKWTNPGGHGEPGETPLQAAMRELTEEAGLFGRDFRYIGEGLAGKDNEIRVSCYTCVVDHGEPNSEGDPDQEAAEFRWVDMNSAGVDSDIRANLHNPDNILLKLMGHQEGEVKKSRKPTIELFRGVLFLDAIVSIQKSVAPADQSLLVERRLFAALASATRNRAKQGVEAAVKAILGRSGDIGPEESALASSAVSLAMAGIGEEARHYVAEAAKEAYRIGKLYSYTRGLGGARAHFEALADPMEAVSKAMSQADIDQIKADLSHYKQQLQYWQGVGPYSTNGATQVDKYTKEIAAAEATLASATAVKKPKTAPTIGGTLSGLKAVQSKEAKQIAALEASVKELTDAGKVYDAATAFTNLQKLKAKAAIYPKQIAELEGMKATHGHKSPLPYALSTPTVSGTGKTGMLAPSTIAASPSVHFPAMATKKPPEAEPSLADFLGPADPPKAYKKPQWPLDEMLAEAPHATKSELMSGLKDLKADGLLSGSNYIEAVEWVDTHHRPPPAPKLPEFKGIPYTEKLGASLNKGDPFMLATGEVVHVHSLETAPGGGGIIIHTTNGKTAQIGPLQDVKQPAVPAKVAPPAVTAPTAADNAKAVKLKALENAKAKFNALDDSEKYAPNGMKLWGIYSKLTGELETHFGVDSAHISPIAATGPAYTGGPTPTTPPSGAPPSTPGTPAAAPPPPPEGPKQASIKPSFTLVDQNAVDALVKHQVYWVGEHAQGPLSQRIAKLAEETMITSGLGRREAAKAFQDAMVKEFGFDESSPKLGKLAIPDGWRGPALQYWEGLAANTVTTARTNGQMRGFTECGVTRYEVVNPKDERTCPICGSLAGRVFEVREAQSLIEKEQSSDDPNQVRSLHPWRSKADIEKATGVKLVGVGVAEDSAKLMKAGHGFPPYHYRCRCYVDMAGDSELVFEEPPPRAFPYPVDSLVKTDKKLTGIHEKHVYRAPDGTEWMFKPAEAGMDFTAVADETACLLAQALEHPTAEVYTVKVGGRFGSIQKMMANVVGDLDQIGPQTLTHEQAHRIQKEHVFDWLIGQHDSHQENFLRTKDGAVTGIDKGQMFKFFGKDELKVGYNPNEKETYYNKMFTAYMGGEQVNLAGVKELAPFIKQIQDMPDEKFLGIVKPYIKAAYEAAEKKSGLKSGTWMGRYTQEEMLAKVLARKNGMGLQMEAFYKDLEAKREAAKPKVAVSKAPASAQARFGPRLAEAQKAGWAGSTFFTAGRQYEGQAWSLYGVDGGGTYLDTRLRPNGQVALLKLLEASGVKTAALPDNLSKPAWQMDHETQLLKAIKSFNYHLKPGGDGKIPPYTAQTAKDLWQKLNGDIANEYLNDKASDKMKGLLYYQEQLKKVWDPQTEAFKPSAVGTIIKHDWDPPAKPEAPVVSKPGVPQGWKVEQTAVSDIIKRKLVDGRTVVESPDPTANWTSMEKAVHNIAGPSYKITTPDGTIIFYKPQANNKDGSQQGMLRVIVNQDIKTVTPERIHQALEHLNLLGLPTHEPAPIDHELVYLRKVAYKNKWNIESAVPEALPAEEQVKKLKEFLKVKGIPTTGPTYKFMPVFDKGGQTGKPRWVGHYFKKADLERYELQHDLFNGVETDMDRIIGGKTHTLVSSNEKMRLGLPPSGMSPDEDTRTGGSNSVFTRLRHKGKGTGSLIFKTDVLADLDNIVYENDEYGRSSALGKRGATFSDWDQFTHTHSNETNVKHGIDLQTNLEYVQVHNETERQKVIAMFKRHGHAEYAGKPLDKLVVVAGNRNK